RRFPPYHQYGAGQTRPAGGVIPWQHGCLALVDPHPGILPDSQGEDLWLTHCPRFWKPRRLNGWRRVLGLLKAPCGNQSTGVTISLICVATDSIALHLGKSPKWCVKTRARGTAPRLICKVALSCARVVIAVSHACTPMGASMCWWTASRGNA